MAMSKNISLSLSILLTLGLSPATAQTTQRIEQEVVFDIPADDAALESLIVKIADEVETLSKRAETKSGPNEQEPSPAELNRVRIVNELLELLKSYLGTLKEYQALRTQVQLLGSESGATQFAEELSALQQDIERVQSRIRSVHPNVTDETIKEVQQKLETAKTTLAARLQSQSERNERMSRYQTAKQTVQEEIQKKKAAYFEVESQHPAKIQAAVDELDRRLAEHELRRAQVEARMSIFRQEILDLEHQRDKRLASQSEQRLPLLKVYVTQLQDLHDKLNKVKTSKGIDEAKIWMEQIQAQPDSFSEVQRLYWSFKLKLLEALEELSGLERSTGFRDRFSQEEKQDVLDEIADDRAIWEQFMESLERRPAMQIEQRYQQIDRELNEWHRKQSQLRLKYDQTYDDRAQIGTKIDAITARLRAMKREFNKAITPSGANSESAALKEEVDAKFDEFGAKESEIVSGLSALAERCNETIVAIHEHINYLSDMQSRLYWSYLSVREAPIWQFSLERVQAEWAEEAHRRANDLNEVKQASRSVSRAGWVTFGAVSAVVLGVMLLVRRRLWNRAGQLEGTISQRLQEENRPFALVSERFHVTGYRFLARVMGIVVPGLLILIFAKLSPLDGRISITAAWFVMSIGVASALIRATFRQTKPRFRLLPCSNMVAKYYRRWLRWILWTSVLLVPLPLLLSVFDWSLHGRQYAWSAYKIILLAMVFLFLLKKSTVLRVAGRREELQASLLHSMLFQGYAFLLLFVIALLTLQVVGYSALTTYIVRGLSLTFATFMFAKLLSRYLAELSQRLSTQIASNRQSEQTQVPDPEPAKPVPAAGREVVLRDEPEEGQDIVISVALLLTIIRWVIVVSAVGLVLFYWGVSWHQLSTWMDQVVIPSAEEDRPPVTIRRILLAALVVTTSWVISRSIRLILQGKIDAASTPFDRGGKIALTKLLHYILIFLGLYIALYVMRIPLGAVTVVLGTLGLGIGLGLQPVFMSFICGLIMLLERHLKIGDVVEIDDSLGEVVNLSIRSTTIRTFDNVDLVIPNSDFITSKVTNWTLKDSRIRGKVPVGVAYGSDPRLVERLLLQAAYESPIVLSEPQPVVRFMNFGDNSLDFTLYVWFNNVADRWEFITNSRYRLVELFNENGIEIPFPQRTLSTVGGQPIRVQVESSPAAKSPESSQS